MKALLTSLTALAALLSFAAIAHAAGDCATVEVQNLHTGQGPLMLAAYTTAEAFSKKTASSQMRVDVTAETMQLQVCGLSGNQLGLMMYQDLNGNGKLDVNPFGMPTEPWGSSGKPPAMSAPTWETAQVPRGDAPIVVKLSK